MCSLEAQKINMWLFSAKSISQKVGDFVIRSKGKISHANVLFATVARNFVSVFMQ